jgi:hypothetical protein
MKFYKGEILWFRHPAYPANQIDLADSCSWHIGLVELLQDVDSLKSYSSVCQCLNAGPKHGMTIAPKPKYLERLK